MAEALQRLLARLQDEVRQAEVADGPGVEHLLELLPVAVRHVVEHREVVLLQFLGPLHRLPVEGFVGRDGQAYLDVL